MFLWGGDLERSHGVRIDREDLDCSPAHVVDEEKDDVGFLVDGEGRPGEYDQKSCEEKKGFHGGSGLK